MGIAWAPTTVEAAAPAVKQTHMGKTAQQWHKVALWRGHKRNELRMSVNELRETVRRVSTAYGSTPLEGAFLCIHSYEGSWTDPNAPYYGGMQMDMSFQRAYGPEFLRAWGTADNWPVSVQLAVSMRAYLSGRGFYPWPNTARYCDLIS